MVLGVQSSMEVHPDEMIPPMGQGTVASLYTTRLVGNMVLNLLHVLQAPNPDHGLVLKSLL